MTFSEYISILEEIDGLTHIEVNNWEANFINSILEKHEEGSITTLSPRQKDVIDKMIEKYL